MERFADFVKAYDLPAGDPAQARAEIESGSWLTTLRGRTAAALRLRGGGRRLAYLDSMFPWERSGFRYHEALALYELRPDTLFFSLWETTDPFPATVFPLADFAKVALSCGVTDAYGVFQMFLEGLVGMGADASHAHPMEGPDISGILRRVGIRLHGSVYPGGGFTYNSYGLQRVRELAGRLTTTFSYIPEVLEEVPGVTPVPQAFTETRFYRRTVERWNETTRMVCLFAADRPPRKGIAAALAAFKGLSPDEFHLHVVGPHEDRRGELPAELATFHGWLSPVQLQALHRRCHAFISPVSIEPPGPDGSYRGVVDGFPTQAAADAMSSGCLLISANPVRDHRVLRPERDYVECEPDGQRLRSTLQWLAANRALVRALAESGSDRVRERMDVRHGAAYKLAHMGFAAGNGVGAGER
jgi:glycosyltransferase involved in cell wall biosynthesis